MNINPTVWPTAPTYLNTAPAKLIAAARAGYVSNAALVEALGGKNLPLADWSRCRKPIPVAHVINLCNLSGDRRYAYWLNLCAADACFIPAAAAAYRQAAERVADLDAG